MAFVASVGIVAADADYHIYVDKNGVMRRNDNKSEVSYYGVNYTVPFAHAYRALGSLGIDHKVAIDRDVYHFARLGFNAYRIHIWDVEISDADGNIVENEHLDLLDYLIAKLHERDISIVITAQTNFGNGYPERNIDTGAYSYDYGKCEMHFAEASIKAQERYIEQLVRHVNPYNGKSYAEDNRIIAIEINNEPCHTATEKEVKDYINRMVGAVKRGEWNKPILYNVSHNMEVVQAYYDSKVDGTTYQWYPVNLVAGYTRKGNFLPYVDDYEIPFSGIRNFNKKAKLVYEFDPADNLYSYLFPAIARTFRKKGFQWITQFSYDPIDMAWANSEYQTHYLNLAYTPRKALSMMIAAEAARSIPRGADYGKYPVDTIFGDFMVSARQDLSVFNDGRKYFYTNNNIVEPKSQKTLQQVAGWGSSPIVSYEGTGAYFLDKLADGVWRLEVMPDVVLTSDPFAKPSLQKRVGEIIYSDTPMSIYLNDLGDTFYYKGINQTHERQGQAMDGEINVYPGVYLLAVDGSKIEQWNGAMHYGDGNKKIGEYVAPKESVEFPQLVHQPLNAIEQGRNLTIKATVISGVDVDSVLVYPEDVSMWRKNNILYRMNKVGNYDYEITIDGRQMRDKDFAYNIVVYAQGKAMTYPQGVEGTPLSWDFQGDGVGSYYNTAILSSQSPIVLIDACRGLDGVEVSTLPTAWNGIELNALWRSPISTNVISVNATSSDVNRRILLKKYVSPLIDCRHSAAHCSTLNVDIERVEGVSELYISAVNRDGFTYQLKLPVKSGRHTIDIDKMYLTTTILSPDPYPVFLKREFMPDADAASPLSIIDIESVQLIALQKAGTSPVRIEISGLWLK